MYETIDIGQLIPLIDHRFRTYGTRPERADIRESIRACASFHDRLVADDSPHLWKDYGPGCHGILEFRREFADSLPGIESIFEHPQPAPKTISYESIEPQFSVWGWHVAADPARALEFLQLVHAGSDGLELVGSGTTTVTTPPFYKDAGAVDVVTSDATRTVTPDAGGR